MKIFVISLLHSTERRTSISRQLAQQGLPFEYIDAFDGNKLTEQDIALHCDPEKISRHPKWISPGAIGCALSHKITYDKIIDENIARALILEDDVLLPENFSSLIAALETKTHHSEVILLYYRSAAEVTLTDSKARTLPIKHLPGQQNYRILEPLNQSNIPGSAVGYIITLQASKTLRDVVYPIHVSSDPWHYFFSRHAFEHISVVYPRPLRHANFKSEIDYVRINKGPLIHWLMQFVNTHRPFLIFQFLKWLRARREKKMSRVRVVSPSTLIL